MRLGAWTCKLEPETLAHRAYGELEISERHRHRYEFNREYEGCLQGGGLHISGRTPDGKFAEIAEVPGHPWYIAVQYHPEFKSKPLVPHPLFADFVRASLENRARRQGRPAEAATAVVR